MTERLRVVYLVGAQHSGSTILETMLQSTPDVFGVGQVGRFYAYPEFPNCNCGLPSASCGPCTRVVDDVFEPEPSTRLVMRLTRRELGLPLFLASGRVRRRYADRLDAIYEATAAATGRTLIVDSSKSISQAVALADASRHEMIFVHCIRDYRGFIRSREKRTEASWPGLDVLRLWKWLFKNHIARFVAPFSGEEMLTVRFEEITEQAVVEQLCSATGVDAGAVFRAIDEEREVERSHLFEPPRQLDYAKVRFDKNRTAGPAQKQSRVLHLLGGWAARRWGY